jgi:hypothetical protein
VSTSWLHRLIAERRLAPFYLGLQDYEDDWEVEAIIQALEEDEAMNGRATVVDAAVEQRLRLDPAAVDLLLEVDEVDTVDLKKQVDGGWVEPQTLLYSRIDYSRPTDERSGDCSRCGCRATSAARPSRRRPAS